MTSPLHSALAFLPAESAAGQKDRPHVAIVTTSEELRRWLADSHPGLQWIQVEDQLDDANTWAAAAQSAVDTPLDVVLSAPAEFASLYRLVDVRASRDVRVTIPVLSGFMKALRLASALGLSVRLLPGQPPPEILQELVEALSFYLHDPMVDAPIEPFHSVLAGMRGADTGTLWMVLEEDPAVFVRYRADGVPMLPRCSDPADETSIAQFVDLHIASILAQGGECMTCPWRNVCGGYFKWPDRTYSCTGVKQLFAFIAEAANELGRDLTGYVPTAFQSASGSSGDADAA